MSCCTERWPVDPKLAETRIAEVEALRARVAELEAENARLYHGWPELNPLSPCLHRGVARYYRPLGWCCDTSGALEASKEAAVRGYLDHAPSPAKGGEG